MPRLLRSGPNPEEETMNRHHFGLRSLFASRRSRRSPRDAQAAPAGRAGCVAEVLEERVLFALAGHPGVSGKLSTNASIAKQQLICDPASSSEPSAADAAAAGSVSVSYDPTLVTLTGVTSGPGYFVDFSNSFVELQSTQPIEGGYAPGTSEGQAYTFLEPLSTFLGEAEHPGTETGYVQVRFQKAAEGSPGLIQPDYTVVDESGVNGFDTHALTFSLVGGGGGGGAALAAAATQQGTLTGPKATYTVFAATADSHSGNPGDFLEDLNGNVYGPGDISPATVSEKAIGAGPAAGLVADPVVPGKSALEVVGTDGPDTIRFEKVGGGLRVNLNGTAYGPFGGFTRVIAYGLGGNDDIQMNAAGSYSVAFFGGMGDDKLAAASGPSLLVGGEGDDRLTGGNGADLLVGGGGKDTLRGGNGDDLLEAGRTAYDDGADADVRALSAILGEWSSSSAYPLRIAHISGTQAGGLNGASLFSTTGVGRTVFDDGDVDTLSGENGRDWLIAGPNDLTKDLAGSEIRTAL
jgi:hypothetical protein